MDKALNNLVKIVQGCYFELEIFELSRNRVISKKSKIKKLDPFLDNDNILRVGGHLRKAPVQYDRKFQIILSYKSHVTDLIIQNEHLKQLHAGPQAVLNNVR